MRLVNSDAGKAITKGVFHW